jgi:hypothetical protein
MRPDLEFVDAYFEQASPREQVAALARARIFISIHGSGLANLLWMASNAVVVEIMPPLFRHDWFAKAARAAGVRHFWFEADVIPGFVDPPGLRACKQPRADRRRQPCSDNLRDQSVHVDLGKFDRELGRTLREA